MIYEPYIHLPTGEITWAWPTDGEPIEQGSVTLSRGHWKPYADFEREKLKELGYCHIVVKEGGYWCQDTFERGGKYSDSSLGLINYGLAEFCLDSEASRLLKRAEFLRAVCEKEGMDWLPGAPEKTCSDCWGCLMHGGKEKCPIHGEHKKPERDYYTKEETEQALYAIKRGEDAWKGRMEVRLSELEAILKAIRESHDALYKRVVELEMKQSKRKR